MRRATPTVYLDLREPRVETTQEDCSRGKHIACTRSRNNQETQEKILEWSQRLELDYVELTGSRKDPELAPVLISV